MGMNNYPSPPVRRRSTLSYARSITSANARRILNFEDMGDDLYYDGIGTVENMKKIFLHYLHRNTFEALRDLTAQAIGIYGLLRAGDQLETTLASLSHKHLPKVLPHAMELLSLSERGRLTTKAKSCMRLCSETKMWIDAQFLSWP